MTTVLSLTKQPSLLQTILEGFLDGILILSETGEWLLANDCAREICNHLAKGVSQSERVPRQIWRACQSLMGSQTLDPDRAVTIEDEIIGDCSRVFRVRARWLELDTANSPCMLVTLEDRHQSIQNAAIVEGQKYGLTPRELVVWQRYRTGYSYQEIADELYISKNTVKKHMKSIHAKRQVILAEAAAN